MGLRSVPPIQQLGFQGKKKAGRDKAFERQKGKKKEKTSKGDRERENSLLTEKLQRDLPGGPGA